MLSRRRFLAASTAATAAGLVAARATTGHATTARATAAHTDPRASADRLGPIGVQLFSLPKLLEHDLDGGLAMLSQLGYREVELFGPYPFCLPEAIASWKALEPQLGFSGSGFFGRTARQMREALDRHALSAPAAHIDLATLRQRLPQVGEAAAQLGIKYIGISNIPPEERRTLDDYKRMADDFNTMGRAAQPLGFKILYHNHGYGLHPMQGEIPFRVLMDRVDPSVVAAEMDLFWTVAGGADPVALLADYPRHYRLMHVKDMSQQGRFAGDGGDASQWFALFPLMTTAGNGVLDLPRILGQARRSGVEHFFVEQDLVANPPEALGASIRYLQAMELAG